MTAFLFPFTRRAVIAGAAGLGLGVAFGGPAQAGAPGDVSDAEAFARQQAGTMIIVDIRTPEEWQETGIASGAVRIDMTASDFVDRMVALRLANPDKEIGLMCRTSHRSDAAQQALTQAGFDRLYSITGGLAGNDEAAGWIADGLPTERCC